MGEIAENGVLLKIVTAETRMDWMQNRNLTFLSFHIYGFCKVAIFWAKLCDSWGDRVMGWAVGLGAIGMGAIG